MKNIFALLVIMTVLAVAIEGKVDADLKSQLQAVKYILSQKADTPAARELRFQTRVYLQQAAASASLAVAAQTYADHQRKVTSGSVVNNAIETVKSGLTHVQDAREAHSQALQDSIHATNAEEDARKHAQAAVQDLRHLKEEHASQSAVHRAEQRLADLQKHEESASEQARKANNAVIRTSEDLKNARAVEAHHQDSLKDALHAHEAAQAAARRAKLMEAQEKSRQARDEHNAAVKEAARHAHAHAKKATDAVATVAKHLEHAQNKLEEAKSDAAAARARVHGLVEKLNSKEIKAAKADCDQIQHDNTSDDPKVLHCVASLKTVTDALQREIRRAQSVLDAALKKQEHFEHSVHKAQEQKREAADVQKDALAHATTIRQSQEAAASVSAARAVAERAAVTAHKLAEAEKATNDHAIAAAAAAINTQRAEAARHAAARAALHQAADAKLAAIRTKEAAAAAHAAAAHAAEASKAAAAEKLAAEKAIAKLKTEFAQGTHETHSDEDRQATSKAAAKARLEEKASAAAAAKAKTDADMSARVHASAVAAAAAAKAAFVKAASDAAAAHEKAVAIQAGVDAALKALERAQAAAKYPKDRSATVTSVISVSSAQKAYQDALHAQEHHQQTLDRLDDRKNAAKDSLVHKASAVNSSHEAEMQDRKNAEEAAASHAKATAKYNDARVQEALAHFAPGQFNNTPAAHATHDQAEAHANAVAKAAEEAKCAKEKESLVQKQTLDKVKEAKAAKAAADHAHAVAAAAAAAAKASNAAADKARAAIAAAHQHDVELKARAQAAAKKNEEAKMAAQLDAANIRKAEIALAAHAAHVKALAEEAAHAKYLNELAKKKEAAAKALTAQKAIAKAAAEKLAVERKVAARKAKAAAAMQEALRAAEKLAVEKKVAAAKAIADHNVSAALAAKVKAAAIVEAARLAKYKAALKAAEEQALAKFKKAQANAAAAAAAAVKAKAQKEAQIMAEMKQRAKAAQAAKAAKEAAEKAAAKAKAEALLKAAAEASLRVEQAKKAAAVQAKALEEAALKAAAAKATAAPRVYTVPASAAQVKTNMEAKKDFMAAHGKVQTIKFFTCPANRANYVKFGEKVNQAKGFELSFSAMGTNDLHIAFMPSKQARSSDAWEIVIGGWGNTKSVIRHGTQGRVLTSVQGSASFGPAGTWRYFWLSYDGHSDTLSIWDDTGSYHDPPLMSAVVPDLTKDDLYVAFGAWDSPVSIKAPIYEDILEYDHITAEQSAAANHHHTEVGGHEHLLELKA